MFFFYFVIFTLKGQIILQWYMLANLLCWLYIRTYTCTSTHAITTTYHLHSGLTINVNLTLIVTYLCVLWTPSCEDIRDHPHTKYVDTFFFNMLCSMLCLCDTYVYNRFFLYMTSALGLWNIRHCSDFVLELWRHYIEWRNFVNKYGTYF